MVAKHPYYYVHEVNLFFGQAIQTSGCSSYSASIGHHSSEYFHYGAEQTKGTGADYYYYYYGDGTVRHPVFRLSVV